jgi:hypothetical protein
MLVTDRAQKFQSLWNATNDAPAPELIQFIRWCMRFDDALMERAILKTAAKFKSTTVDAERAHRYATRLLLNLHEESKGALSV